MLIGVDEMILQALGERTGEILMLACLLCNFQLRKFKQAEY